MNGSVLHMAYKKLFRLLCFLSLISLVFILAGEGESMSYNGVVSAKEILDKISKGETVNCSDKVIKGDLDLDSANLSTTSIIRNYNATYTYNLKNKIKLVRSNISIMNCKIEGNVRFSNAKFLRPVLFMFTDFVQQADFSGSVFSEAALFADDQFFNHTSFDIGRFEKGASFSSSKFQKNAYFRECIFVKEGTFFNTVFQGDAYFLYSKFAGLADFANSNFGNYAYFWDTFYRNGSSFWKSRFSNDAYFEGSLFKGRAIFSDTKFNEHAYFGKANFQNIADLNNSQMMKEAYFDGAIFDKNSTLFLNRAKINKLYLRWNDISSLGYDDEAYLFLIENYKNLGWFDDSNNCYYQYRISHPMNFLVNPIQYTYDRSALISYGYGVKPERPLILSILTVLICGAIFYFFHGIKRSSKSSDSDQKISIWESIHYSASAFTSGASAFISYPTEIIPVGNSRYLVTLERFLGWIFFTLLLVTLANTAIH
jgi:hypothetical protein